MLKCTTKFREKSFLDFMLDEAISIQECNIKSRIQQVNIVSGTLSSVMGLKVTGSDVSPFLCMPFSIHMEFHQIAK